MEVGIKRSVWRFDKGEDIWPGPWASSWKFIGLGRERRLFQKRGKSMNGDKITGSRNKERSREVGVEPAMGEIIRIKAKGKQNLKCHAKKVIQYLVGNRKPTAGFKWENVLSAGSSGDRAYSLIFKGVKMRPDGRTYLTVSQISEESCTVWKEIRCTLYGSNQWSDISELRMKKS